MQNRKNPQNQFSSDFSRQMAKFAALLCGLFFFAYFLTSCSQIVEKTDSNPIKYVPIPEDLKTNTTNSAVNTNTALTNTSQEILAPMKFPHNNQYHSEVSCAICHRRDTNAARVSFPGRENHAPCIGCHTQQFSDNKSPFCGICHTNAESGNLRAFPPLRSFGVRFDHARHARNGNCTTCHKPASGGVTKTIPGGAGTHALCFQCHSSNSSFRMSSCGTCHQPGQRKTLATAQVTNYRVNFSHAKHNLNCATCHSVRSANQMSAPLQLMHHAPKNTLSCASCHNNSRAFGGDDFTDCKRCHRGKDFAF